MNSQTQIYSIKKKKFNSIFIMAANKEKMCRIFIFLLLLHIPFASVADECQSYKEARYKSIRTANTFKGPNVGYAGRTSKEVREFRCILDRPGADRVLKNLLSDSTPPGKLYALAGLFLSNRSLFEKESKRFEGMNFKLDSQFGCTVFPSSFLSVLKKIEKGHLAKRLAGDRDSTRNGGHKSSRSNKSKSPPSKPFPELFE